MSENTPEPNTDIDGWDDEIFAEFVSGAGSADDLADEDASVLQVNAVKEMLASLEGRDACAGDDSLKKTRGNKGNVWKGRPKNESVHEFDPTHEAESSNVEQKGLSFKTIEPARIRTIECPELCEAFMEDASRGIAALDQAVINYESDTDREEALGQVCRELHTLKGAGAVVGLTDTARYIHDIEDFIQNLNASPCEITDVLLECLATLRRQVQHLVSGGEPEDNTPKPTVDHSPRLDPVSEGEDTISVKGEQLDRLLDMLTALTMLNNQRDTHVEQLRDINSNLTYCGNRIRDLERNVSKSSSTGQDPSALSAASNPLQEVANDVNEIGKLLRDAYSPITREHAAISNFIRQFRHALVSILRTPVSGMFRRLQRASLDAARVERKQVRLEIIGSDAGLERSVQERLLDPLMHIVRNAVSHGIELPEVREENGKDSVGTVTLEAVSAPNLLTLNVRDDGRGLDYDALRRRGTELGLLKDSREATPQELGQLIFRRGFSTREQANEIAGRGIGMDVVADTLEKMHAWVEVESNPGQGTNIRLTVPLKSITEHALIVRVGEHLAALPMQYVRSAADATSSADAEYPQLAHALNIPITTSATSVVSLEYGHAPVKASSAPQTISCLVDEILGPQEVVVRPLPALLRNQKLFAGVTLSANGNIVYVLEPRRLAATIHTIVSGGESFSFLNTAPINESSKEINVLVVDDSLSARNSVSQLCKRNGWNPVQAQDGVSGLDLLDQDEWAAVITDFDMPQMDGIRFIESLRVREQMNGVPILMVSSRSSADMEEKALVAGATHYVTKPLTAEAIDKLLVPIINKP